MNVEHHLTVKNDGLPTIDAAIQWARRTVRDQLDGYRVLNVSVYPPFDAPFPTPEGLPVHVAGKVDTWTASVTALRLEVDADE